MSTAQPNPLFTRSERGRFGRTMKKRAKHVARKGLSKIFGIPLSSGLGAPSAKTSRHRAHRPSSGHGPSNSVRSDVISALRGQGYSSGVAKKMAEGVRDGDSFESAFRRVISRNPAELIIFGNPAKVYGRKTLQAMKRAGNPIPAALLEGFGFTAGQQLFDDVTKGGKKRKSHRGDAETRRKARKRKNPDQQGKAEQLFETFHHRGAAGTFERQRSARQRKDYTILGPLVAIGINPEYFDKMEARAGKKQFADWAVEHYDQLPRLDFMTPGQVDAVKHILGDPAKYVMDAPLLASSPNGRQLYALAEDVQIDLSKFETDAAKDYVDLGDATFVVYIAKKPHEVREWVHMMGENGGTRPRLMYDRLRKEVCFIGGSYVVKGPGIMH